MLRQAQGRWYRRRGARAALVAAGVLLASYAVAATATAATVPRGTTVASVEVGGLSRARAEEALEAGLAERTAAPVPVSVGDATDQLDPAASGLGLDAAGTVDAAVGPAWSPVSLWRHAAGGGEVAPVSDVDAPALEAALTELADRVGDPAVEGAITFEGGEPVVVEPAPGTTVDVAAARARVAEEWLGGERPVVLPTAPDVPEVDREAVERALAEFAEPAVAAPLAVAVGDRTVELPVDVVAPLLSTTPEGGELVGRVDGAGLVAAVLSADPEAVAVPQDARIEIAGGAPRVVPGVPGTAIDEAALADAAATALARTGAERVATAELAESEPEVTTAEAEALGVVELIAEFATTLTPDAPRTENITIAAREVDGTLLLPGETFSLNETLGQRTPDKGYNQAGVISGGKLTKDYGGGVSQLATTLFNGMFFAGLDEVEHKAHSLYFSRYPEGREATVAWPSVDLKFTNDSGKGVLIQTWVAGGEVRTAFWGTKLYDVEATKSPRRNVRTPVERVETGEDCAPQSPITGFDVTVTRTFRQAGAVVRTEEFPTSYNKLDAVRCEAAPAAPPVDPQAAAPDAAPSPPPPPPEG